MRVIGKRLCFVLCIPWALLCYSAETKKEAKRPNWPPKLGIKTPGVQIPFGDLKPDAEIAVGGPVDGLLLNDAAYVVSRSKDVLTPVNAKTNRTEEGISGFHAPCVSPVNAFGSIWVGNCTDQTISRYDAKTKKITATVASPLAPSSHAMSAGSDSLWVLVDEKTTLARIDPDANKIVAEIRLEAACNSLLFAENALWVSCPKEDKVLRVDTHTNLVSNRVEVPARPVALTFGEGSIWVLSQTDGKLSRIDPKTNKVTATIELKTPGIGGDVVFAEGFAWVSAPGYPVMRIDPGSDKVVQQFAGDGGGAIYAGLGSIWIANLKPNTLSRFDPKRIKATLAD